MLLGLATAALVLSVLVWELSRPKLAAGVTRARVRAHERRVQRQIRRSIQRSHELDYDPGRERRAEQRARELLRSCVSAQDWAMYRDLGFLRVWGAAVESAGRAGLSYAYLIYPHKPIVAYVPQTGRLLSEYCVAFPDLSPLTQAGRHVPYRGGETLAHARTSPSSGIPVLSEPQRPVPSSRPSVSASGPRLPDADDVLAKWMVLRADERRLIAHANMHLPGRQIDPRRIRRDLARLAAWEREREGLPALDSVRAA